MTLISGNVQSDISCPNAYCHQRLWVFDTVEINGKLVEFLGCTYCQKSYTRNGTDMELIS